MALRLEYWPRPWRSATASTHRELLLRTLVVAALLALGATSPVLATSRPAAGSSTSVVVQGLPDGGAAGPIRAKKKKKLSRESAKFEEIGNAKRGKPDLEIKVKVSRSERSCELKIKWKNGDTSEGNADAKDEKLCEFSISVPDARDAVGDATATVTVKDASGNKVASAKKTFPVK